MKGILLVLCALPFGAVRAEPIIAEFEGTITSVWNDSGYAEGERITGRLFIDTLRAGPDLDPSPNRGVWGDDGTEDWPSFVTGFATGFAIEDSPSGLSTDRAQVSNNLVVDGQHTDLDGYGVAFDRFSGQGGTYLSVSARIHGMLDDADLRQSFEVTSADVDEEDEWLTGTIAKFFETNAHFLISRLTVRPGRCFAPT